MFAIFAASNCYQDISYEINVKKFKASEIQSTTAGNSVYCFS